jgi:hypothetical protein
MVHPRPSPLVREFPRSEHDLSAKKAAHPQPDVSAIEMTDEEIWRAIRDLDPDQRRNATDVACVIAIVVACVVWYWLIFAASK